MLESAHLNLSSDGSVWSEEDLLSKGIVFANMLFRDIELPSVSIRVPDATQLSATLAGERRAGIAHQSRLLGGLRGTPSCSIPLRYGTNVVLIISFTAEAILLPLCMSMTARRPGAIYAHSLQPVIRKVVGNGS